MTERHDSLEDGRSGRAPVGLAILVSLGVLAFFVHRFWWTCDDAFITFRYAKNLAEGRGLSFNPGEAPPVEGYSNFLWTLVLAGFQSAGVSLELAAGVLGAGCAALLLALVVRHVARGDARAASSAVWGGGLTLATLPPVAIWATSGLETMAFATCLFGLLAALVGRTPRVGIAALCAALAVLLRVDGVLWCGLVLAAVFVSGPGVFAARARSVVLVGLALAATFAAHLVWRHGYYGSWMSNTAAVKGGFSLLRLERGFDYVVSFLLAAPAFALVPLVALVVLRGGARRAVAPMLWVVLGGCAYAVAVGGDFMAMGRFLVPVAPLVAVLAAMTIGALRAPMARLAYGGLVVLVGVAGMFDSLPVPPALRQTFHFRRNSPEARSEVEQWEFMRLQAEGWATLGRALGEHAGPGRSLIRGNIGATGYFSDLFLYDLNGLVIPRVAREAEVKEGGSPGHDLRVEPSFFLQDRPTYLDAFIRPTWFPIDKGIGAYGRELLDAERVSLERYPLSPEQGFEEGTELRLLRFQWGD